MILRTCTLYNVHVYVHVYTCTYVHVVCDFCCLLSLHVGMALIIEGFMSSLYHTCPTNANFQFGKPYGVPFVSPAHAVLSQNQRRL